MIVVHECKVYSVHLAKIRNIIFIIAHIDSQKKNINHLILFTKNSTHLYLRKISIAFYITNNHFENEHKKINFGFEQHVFTSKGQK